MRTDVALIRWTSREKMSATSLAQVSPAIMHQGLLRRLLSGSLPGGGRGFRRLPFFDRINDYDLHDGRRFGVRDSRGYVQVLQAVLLGILPLEQPGGRVISTTSMGSELTLIYLY